MNRGELVFIDPPSFSDGADGEGLMANHLGEPFTHLTSLTSSTFVRACGELLYELRYGTTHGKGVLEGSYLHGNNVFSWRRKCILVETT
jgi:hypothetical protein